MLSRRMVTLEGLPSDGDGRIQCRLCAQSKPQNRSQVSLPTVKTDSERTVRLRILSLALLQPFTLLLYPCKSNLTDGRKHTSLPEDLSPATTVAMPSDMSPSIVFHIPYLTSLREQINGLYP